MKNSNENKPFRYEEHHCVPHGINVGEWIEHPKTGELCIVSKVYFWRNKHNGKTTLTWRASAESASTGSSVKFKIPAVLKDANSRSINRAIKHLGIEIVYTRADGYFYFLDLETGFQVGESVYVCYLNQLTLEQWVDAAEAAAKEGEV